MCTVSPIKLTLQTTFHKKWIFLEIKIFFPVEQDETKTDINALFEELYLLYNYETIFLYKSFFVNYILSFSLVGFWTIRLLVQVHRHWVQFTLTRRGYDNHNCHNKPQIGNRTGVWMTSCPEAMGWEFGYFEKHVSLVFTGDQSSWLSNGDRSS